MKKITIYLICSSFLYCTHIVKANNDEKKNISYRDNEDRFSITDEQLKMTVHEKKRLQKSLTFDQFLMILEDIATIRLQNKEYAKRIKTYEEWEATEKERIEKIEQDHKAEIAEYEEKLKNFYPNGDMAKGQILEQIKSQGIDPSKLKFRVQIGETNTYKAAEILKQKVRALGLETWILPVYKGYVIPLKLVEDQITK